MKYIFLTLALLSSSFSALSEPLYCAGITQSICSDAKSSFMYRELAKNIQRQFMGGITSQSTLTQRRLAGTPSIQLAENSVYAELKVTKDDIKNLFAELKTELKGLISGHPSLSQDVKAVMFQNLSNTELIMEYQIYFNTYSALLKKAYPQNTADTNSDHAFGAFASNCSDTGMVPNAMNSMTFENNAFHGSIIICPGWLGYMTDRMMTRSQALNSLAMIIGHELGHSLGAQFFKESYKLMGECYNAIKKDPSYWEQKGDETSADYWATLLFSQRISAQGINNQDLVNQLGHATHNFCDLHLGPKHPVGFDRIEYTFSRNKAVLNNMGCSPVSEARPYCDIDGIHTR
jgi:hypothetical protein